MIALLKYLRGYVRIKVWGFSPERFMNLCSNKNILLWDIKKEGEVYYMCISLKGFWGLRPIARKTGTRVAVLERCGLPFFIPRLLARKIFVLGFAAAVFFWFWTSLYVWDISLMGNYTITEDIFIDFLKQQGIHVGMSKKDVDIGELEKEIRRQFDIITWTSARMEGTKLKIEIKENTNLQTAPDEDEKYPYGSNLTADTGGTIVSMIVRSGVPQVQTGQEIAQGDLLVSGRVPVLNEDATVRKYQYVRADADIYVRHTIPVRETLPFYYVDQVYTGREKKKYYILSGEKEYTLSFSEITYPYYDIVSDSRDIELLKGLTLPFSFGTFTYREYLNVEKEYSLQEAEALLGEKYSEILATLEQKGVQIIEKNVKIDTESNGWILQGELTVEEKTGLEETIVPEETGSEDE
ncbi:MAG: sporulation protein YqfD [Lachnospiraceae bacterium]|nr:sporulation protein YqfD [Lachnospiraceae bacterium]